MPGRDSRCITVIGLGPGSFENLTCGVLKEMEDAERVCMRTLSHPITARLQQRGIHLCGFDDLYEGAETFERVYEEIAERLLEEADLKGKALYAVPGHPMVAEAAVRLLLDRGPARGVAIRIIPGLSSIEAAYAALHLDPLDGLELRDALEIARADINPGLSLMVLQIYNPMVASAVKLRLMDFYPDDHEVSLLQAAGTEDEMVSKVPLYEIDRGGARIDHLTILYVPPLPKAADGRMETLLDIMKLLRGPGGCPWDAQQDHASLRPYLLEETYEVLEALDNEDAQGLCEELGDLLLQIVFHAEVADERDDFDFSDVVAGITRKLRRRHPHVFGDVVVSGAGEVLRNWEAIKLKEKAAGGEEEPSLLKGVQRSLPALARSQKMQIRAARAGFDWPDTEGILEKVCEEAEELRQEVAQGNVERSFAEMGDLFFSLVNLSRRLGINAEDALRGAADRFVERFGFIEREVRRSGRSWEEYSLQELDSLWDKAKREA